MAKKKKKKILLIDDDRDFSSMVKLVLEQEGYQVEAAFCGDEAMRKLQAGVKPDAMILDVVMSGRPEGIMFARTVRKNWQFQNIPILMLTGMRGAAGFGPVQDDPRDPVFLPVDVFLEKPVLPEVLLAKLEAMLGRSR